jgi:hypothetical protein
MATQPVHMATQPVHTATQPVACSCPECVRGVDGQLFEREISKTLMQLFAWYVFAVCMNVSNVTKVLLLVVYVVMRMAPERVFDKLLSLYASQRAALANGMTSLPIELADEFPRTAGAVVSFLPKNNAGEVARTAGAVMFLTVVKLSASACSAIASQSPATLGAFVAAVFACDLLLILFYAVFDAAFSYGTCCCRCTVNSWRLGCVLYARRRRC